MGAEDDSFKRPGAVPFKWEIQPGVPRAQPQPTPPKLSPPPSGISFYPPHHTTLHVRVPSPRSKSAEHHRRITSGSRHDSPRNGVAVATTGCFPMPSPRRKLHKKIIYRSDNVKSEDGDIDDTGDLQTLARWSVSSQKSLSSTFSSSSSPMVSPFCTPRRVQDAEWAAYGLF